MPNPSSRRDWLKAASAGACLSAYLGMPALGGIGGASAWFSGFARAAEADPKRRKSVILLWLNGGPATIDLWDLKPGHANGGPFGERQTQAPGLKISEHLPKLAAHGKDLTIIRSMATKEGDHSRAVFLARTGYIPQGAILFPAFGSVLASESPERDASDLPGFVSIGPRRFASELGGGFLGPKFAPLVVGEGAQTPKDLTVPNLEAAAGVQAQSLKDRQELLTLVETRGRGRMANAEAGQGAMVGADLIEGIRAANESAFRLMRPSAKEAFQLNKEADSLRAAYGMTAFGQGCLLARRLVERGVACVEVTLDGWDSHANNFDQVKTLSAVLDRGYATLLDDLRSRGLLDSTIVVCMGEFGRTPKINAASGRDHWPSSWALTLSGGGIVGGKAVGKTSADGMAVEETPVTVPDLIATICQATGIDPRKQNPSNANRPIRIADPAAKVIPGVL